MMPWSNRNFVMLSQIFVLFLYYNVKVDSDLKRQIHYTPWNVSVSSKHVLSVFDDGNRVIFPITPAVKGTGSPAVSGGAVTQHPLRVESNSRGQELIKVTLVRYIATYYSRMRKKT